MVTPVDASAPTSPAATVFTALVTAVPTVLDVGTPCSARPSTSLSVYLADENGL